MSAFGDLIHWLQFTGVKNLSAADIEKMLTEALTELKDSRTEERREALFVVHTVLTQARSGKDPLPGLRFLAKRYKRVTDRSEEPVGIVLERQVRELAEDLLVEDWKTGAFLVLEAALSAYSDGSQEVLHESIRELDLLLQNAWEPYVETSIMESEITAETVVGHRLLKDGFDSWFQALDQVEVAVADGTAFDQALGLAEEGNRLLVAVQRADNLTA